MKYQANPVIVEAHTIVSVGDRNTLGDTPLALSNGENVTATGDMTARYQPQAGDYWVIQEDSYVYLNPKEVFERKYAAISPDEKAA